MNLKFYNKEKKINTFIITGKVDNEKILNNLINCVRENEKKELHSTTNVKGKFTGFKGVVSNQDFHYFLKLIEPAIKVIFNNNFIVYDAWGNILEKDGEVLEHDHIGTTAFCGIIYLSEKGPGTYFKDYDITIEEEIGKFVLFHPILSHSVKKINENIERITVAFNCNKYNPWTIKDK
jgi:hypothetical protein